MPRGGLSLTHGWQNMIDGRAVHAGGDRVCIMNSSDGGGGQRIWGNEMRQCRHAQALSLYLRCSFAKTLKDFSKRRSEAFTEHPNISSVGEVSGTPLGPIKVHPWFQPSHPDT